MKDIKPIEIVIIILISLLSGYAIGDKKGFERGSSMGVSMCFKGRAQ